MAVLNRLGQEHHGFEFEGAAEAFADDVIDAGEGAVKGQPGRQRVEELPLARRAHDDQTVGLGNL